MEKEKALNLIRRYRGNWIDEVQDAIETLVPELKASDDERIMEAILREFEGASDSYLIDTYGLGKMKFIAYLEKQKDSHDMSFHEGYTLGFDDGVKSVEQKERSHFVMQVLSDGHMKKAIEIYSDECDCKAGDVVKTIIRKKD